jgi:hypothetical protein
MDQPSFSITDISGYTFQFNNIYSGYSWQGTFDPYPSTAKTVEDNSIEGFSSYYILVFTRNANGTVHMEVTTMMNGSVFDIQEFDLMG